MREGADVLQRHDDGLSQLHLGAEGEHDEVDNNPSSKSEPVRRKELDERA